MMQVQNDEGSAVNLTANSSWEYRVSSKSGAAGGWHPHLHEARAELFPVWTAIHWPRTWNVYGMFRDADVHRKTRCPVPLRSVGSVPEMLREEAVSFPRRILEERPEDGFLDLAALFGHAGGGLCAYLTADVDLKKDTTLILHAGADWWMQWWVDGEELGDTLEHGNHCLPHMKAHRYRHRLSAGTHRFAVRVTSGTQGWGLMCEATAEHVELEEGDSVVLEAKRVFTIRNFSQFVSLTLRDAGGDPVCLNGHPLMPELEGVQSRDRIGIAPDLLKAGENILEKRWEGSSALGGLRAEELSLFEASGDDRCLSFPGTLHGIPVEAVALRGPPVLGWADTRTLTLACRTNARVSLRMCTGSREHVSPQGLVHHFLFSNLPAGERFPYKLFTPDERVVGQGTAHTLPKESPVTLAVLGDPSPNPERFQEVANHLMETPPDLVLWLGDLTSHGGVEEAWEDDFFARAPSLFPNIPSLAIPGNHEKQTPLFEKLFVSPGGKKNWEFRQGPVTLIGIDGQGDWSPGSPNYRWLEARLSETVTPFVVLANHYPAFSSSGHGRLDADGLPLEPPVRNSRQFILPLAVKHRVTAYVSGHEHGYERSMLPGNMTQLICAGAGGRIYETHPGSTQNAFSLVRAGKHHIGYFRISPDALVFEAFDLEGNMLDRMTWNAAAGT